MCFEEFFITSLQDLADGDREMLLCPVRAVKWYISRTDQYFPASSNLFISNGRVKKYASKNIILSWLKSVIKETYRSASDSNCTAVKASAHRVWNITHWFMDTSSIGSSTGVIFGT